MARTAKRGRRSVFEDDVTDESMAFDVSMDQMRVVFQRVANGVSHTQGANLPQLQPIDDMIRNDYFVQKHANGMKFVRDVLEKDIRKDKGKKVHL